MTAAVILLGFAVAGCGGGKSDEAAIESMVDEFLSALVDSDAEKLVGLFSDECTGIEEAASSALEEFPGRGQDWEFTISKVEIRNLHNDTAEILPRGAVLIDGEERPFDDEEYLPVVREGGKWKRADCDFFDR